MVSYRNVGRYCRQSQSLEPRDTEGIRQYFGDRYITETGTEATIIDQRVRGQRETVVLLC